VGGQVGLYGLGALYWARPGMSENGRTSGRTGWMWVGKLIGHDGWDGSHHLG
jgi:hypothetical protein